MRNAAQDDPQTETAQRLLQTSSGVKPLGALVVRGKLSSLVLDGLAALAAIAIDRHQSFEKEERAETAKQSEQLRTAVLDAMAHELKTPLTAVQTASSGLLELKGLTNSQAELATLINSEALHLNEICTRLLVTARLDGRKVSLHWDEVNVKDLISKVMASQQPLIERNRIQAAVEDPELVVYADRELLTTILAQYIDNARKYSTPGTQIEVAARKSRTGIGLSVVRKAAEAHHGHVWVISDDREGTTFFFSLPMGARRKQ